MTMTTTASAEQILPMVQDALARGITPWVIFFNQLIERGLAKPFSRLTANPTTEQVAQFLSSVQNFPQEKIHARIERISRDMGRGNLCAEVIAGDFADWIQSLEEKR